MQLQAQGGGQSTVWVAGVGGEGGVSQVRPTSEERVEEQRVQHRARLVALQSELVAAERSVSSVKQLIREAERSLARLDAAATQSGRNGVGVERGSAECICIMD